MGKPRPKKALQTVPLGGAVRGMSNLVPHMMNPGEVVNLENFMFHKEGVETRLGWKTIVVSNVGGFSTFASYTGSAGGGQLFADMGSYVGYALSDDTKIAVFTELARLQDETDIDFIGANTKTFTKPGSLPWLGVVFFANTFLLYTEDDFYSIRSGIDTTAFTGSGLDDCTSNSSGYLDNSKSMDFRVEIDSTGIPDTFRWSNDGGTIWNESGVEIDGSAQELSDGVEITFAATTGHTLNDYWDISTGPSHSVGALIEEVIFRRDLGYEFGPIIGMFVRYGQLWVISKHDKIFWSAILKYKISGGIQIENQGLEKTWTVWQTIYGGPIFSMDEVEYMSFFKGATAINNGYKITSGTDYVFVEGTTSDWSDGDAVYPENQSETKTIKTSGVSVPTTNPAIPVGIGATQFYIPKDASKYYRSFRKTPHFDYIKIKEGATEEILQIQGSTDGGGSGWLLSFVTVTVNAYTVAAVVTHESVVKIEMTSNWSGNYNSANLVKDVWDDVPDADYDISLDPDNDPNAEGHIRFKDTPTVKNSEGLRCSFTPVDNAWVGGVAGDWDIASDQGNNIAYAEGPNAREEEGAGLIYIFKTNGDIHAVTGRPGFQGGPGNMDATVVATGIIARANTPAVSREGVYFGAINGIKYNAYFIPHGSQLAGKEQIPILTETFDFDGHLPLDDSSYTIKERSIIVDGDKYAIFFQFYTGSNVPSTNGYIYIGQAYREGDMIKGRWSRMKEHAGDEYEDDSGNVLAAGGAPSTEGLYFHNDTLCRIYKLRAGHDYTGNAHYYYEIATYGWYDGGEECKDRHVYTYDAGGGSYITERSTDFFWPKLKTAMIKIANKILVDKLFIDQDIIGGTEADGIDMLVDIFTDVRYETSIFEIEGPKIINDITDDVDGLRLLTEINLSFKCKYIQFDFTWKNIKYRDKPTRVIYRDSAIQFALLTPKGKLEEEDI